MTKHSLRLALTAPAACALALVFMTCLPATNIEPPPETWEITSPTATYDAATGILTIKSSAFTTSTTLEDITTVQLQTVTLTAEDTPVSFAEAGQMTVSLVTSRAAVDALDSFKNNGSVSEGLKIVYGLAKKGILLNKALKTALTISGYADAILPGRVSVLLSDGLSYGTTPPPIAVGPLAAGKGTLEFTVPRAIVGTGEPILITFDAAALGSRTISPDAPVVTGDPGTDITASAEVEDNVCTVILDVVEGDLATFDLEIGESEKLPISYRVTITVSDS